MDDVSEASLASTLAVIHELIRGRHVLRGGKALSGRVDTRRIDHGTSVLGSNPCAAGSFVDSTFPDSINDTTIIQALLSDKDWSGAQVQITIGTDRHEEDWTITITRDRLVFACFYRLIGHSVTDEDEASMAAALLRSQLVDAVGPIYSTGPLGPPQAFGTAPALYLDMKLRHLAIVMQGLCARQGEYQGRSSVALRDRLNEILSPNSVLASTRELRSRGAMKHFVRDCDEWVLRSLGDEGFAELIARSVGVSLEKWLLAGRKSVMISA